MDECTSAVTAADVEGGRASTMPAHENRPMVEAGESPTPCERYLEQIGVRPTPRATCPFDPGYDPVTVEAHLRAERPSDAYAEDLDGLLDGRRGRRHPTQDPGRSRAWAFPPSPAEGRSRLRSPSARCPPISTCAPRWASPGSSAAKAFTDPALVAGRRSFVRPRRRSGGRVRARREARLDASPMSRPTS